MPDGEKFTPKGEDEIRKEVITEFGLDPDNEDNKPFIEKAVKKEIDRQNERIESQKKLSKAIEQKKQWREKATKILSEDDDDENGEPKPKEDNTQKPENEELKAVKNELNEIKTSLHRNKYPNLSDEEYNSIKAIATTNSKSFEETIESNPIAKSYFETAQGKERIAGAMTSPSTRSSSAKAETEDEKVANELDRDLPVGFTSKKS